MHGQMRPPPPNECERDRAGPGWRPGACSCMLLLAVAALRLLLAWLLAAAACLCLLACCGCVPAASLLLALLCMAFEWERALPAPASWFSRG